MYCCLYVLFSFPTCWSERVTEYPPPLFAAVQHDSTWAVELLLSHGADPASHHRGRYTQVYPYVNIHSSYLCMYMKGGVYDY